MLFDCGGLDVGLFLWVVFIVDLLSFGFCCVLYCLFVYLLGFVWICESVLGLIEFVIFLWWFCLVFDAGVLAGSAGGFAVGLRNCLCCTAVSGCSVVDFL